MTINRSRVSKQFLASKEYEEEKMMSFLLRLSFLLKSKFFRGLMYLAIKKE